LIYLCQKGQLATVLFFCFACSVQPQSAQRAADYCMQRPGPYLRDMQCNITSTLLLVSIVVNVVFLVKDFARPDGRQAVVPRDPLGFAKPLTGTSSKGPISSRPTSPSHAPSCAPGRPVSRALVTGISGMIGSHVARELARDPCVSIFGLVRPRSNLDTLTGVLSRITLVAGDLTDAHRMLDVMVEVRPTVVFHFGAQAINGISYANPDVTIDANVRGTLNLLEGVHRAGLAGFKHPSPTRVLLAGSSTEYGRTVDDVGGPLDELSALQPVTPYGVSKAATELLGNMYNSSYGVPVVTARFFIQIGVGGTDSLAIHQFCRQIALAEAGLAPAVIEHGNIDTARDMTDARDSAPVIVQLARDGIAGQAYNVGSGLTTKISDLLAMAVSHARVSVVTRADPTRWRAYDERLLLANNNKVRALTGWVPGTNLSESVGTIMEYWRRKTAALYGSIAAGGAPESEAHGRGLMFSSLGERLDDVILHDQ
jgi:GDP-4-dehydro-6-deoxy-D-mannose reductase